MTSIPQDDPKHRGEGEGTKPQERPFSEATFESIFDALGRDLGRPLSEIIPHLSAEGKSRVLDMLLARMEERERAPKGGSDDGANP